MMTETMKMTTWSYEGQRALMNDGFEIKWKREKEKKNPSASVIIIKSEIVGSDSHGGQSPRQIDQTEW